jgi:aspartyl-tRNA(Asn)/glutamyl-tRNA(Gln) amidotransferase subunit A
MPRRHSTGRAAFAINRIMNKTSARDRLEQALTRIADPKGEGARACLNVYADTARGAADASDARRKSGTLLGPLDGAIVSNKDLFDVKGDVTRAGSKILAEEGKPAAADAPVVQRLRAAGAVIVAKTNMSEFAFHGIGTNPHFGTPGNPCDRARAPGGSTSGGAVAVADGMCEIAIGSDTGGSTRAPAAFCGLVGWKPSRQRVPTDGAFPLSFSLDSIGPMAMSVADCANTDAIMAGEMLRPVEAAPLAGLRFGIPQGFPLASLDETVTAAFQAALKTLTKAGVRLSDETIPLLDEMVQANSLGGFAPAEAYAIHRERLKRRAKDVDANVYARVSRGETISAADYIDMSQMRRRLIAAMDARMSDFDALVLPTCPIVAPRIDEVATVETFGPKNMLTLRNTSTGNFFDLCAISLPMPRGSNGLATGLMLFGRNGHDARLFRIAAAVEKALAS